MKNLIWIFGFLLLLTSCGGDDDICLNSDSTPRLKLKFHDSSNRLIRLDSLYVDVDYGNDNIKTIIAQANVDSVFIPLRIDNSPYTDIYFRLRKREDTSKVRINYTNRAIYVSPACGFKQNYDNLNAELMQNNPVQNVESNYTSLTDETRINFYLRF